MVYQYVAYNDGGELVKGTLSATSEEAAANLLELAGYRALTIEQYLPFLNLDKVSARLFPVKSAEIILFWRQLATLLESGIDIVSSLELLQEQASNRTLKKVLGAVISDLRSGNRLSAALGKHPDVFPPLYHRLVSIGEQSGNFETVLRQIADYMEKDAATSKEIKGALRMPIITSVVAILVIGLLVAFVLPSFGRLYSSLGVDLPPIVKVLIDATNILQSYGVFILLALLVATVLVIVYIRTPNGRYQRDKLAFRLPLLGRVTHMTELAQFCRSMSLLFRAGLPLTEVMSVLIQGTNNRAMVKAIVDVQQDMVKGEGLSQPMAKNQLFLPMMVRMVRVGEETGNLDTALTAVARNYEADAGDKARNLIGLIQPAMTLIIGGIVGFLALSLTSGMYSIFGQGI
jgi:type IV pilus assembly protein PilC